MPEFVFSAGVGWRVAREQRERADGLELALMVATEKLKLCQERYDCLVLRLAELDAQLLHRGPRE